ncbi:unnamed protein product [Adineta ricciae]|uniref:G-protein coupled receptors family 1 profile domain-containing protein n=2 Tax=Adineta ricciae TaxID=249248 RepID=A0A815JBY2_ADIRI|nr:unnamed protein product [Adineta ricciae]
MIMITSNETNLEFEAQQIKWYAMTFIRCFCLIMIPFGIIGHLLSIFVFTRRTLRTNPCVMYLFAATVSGLLSSCFILPMRLIQAGYINIDPTLHSLIACKIIWFLLYSIRLLGFWFIVLACIDRYLCSCSSADKRAWSSTRVASRAILITTIMCFLAYVHIPIHFRFYIEPATQKRVCHSAGPLGIYRKIFSFYNLIIFGFLPPFCMFIFGLLTLKHIRHKTGLCRITSTKLTALKAKVSDRQLCRMLFTQVFIYGITGSIFCLAFIHISMNKSSRKTILDIAYEDLTITIVGMLSNIGPCSSFYLYTLTSHLFRKELKSFFYKLFGYQVQPNDIQLTITLQSNSC